MCLERFPWSGFRMAVPSGDGLTKHKQGNWEAPHPEGVIPRQKRAPLRSRPTGQTGHTLIPQARKQASKQDVDADIGRERGS